ncbi:hypothetical protein F383_25261 [Gossypium arboreum]|uniref:Uncharacterized protein n=1 Tax=Gossypium arboreum TaxID=29729 RepID=A0A0B0P503_GOSAR|nr:hypothetical protein F383_25261 [Gossypium arboreum]
MLYQFKDNSNTYSSNVVVLFTYNFPRIIKSTRLVQIWKFFIYISKIHSFSH